MQVLERGWNLDICPGCSITAVTVMWQVAMTQCEVTSAGLYRDPDLATSCQCGGAWHGEPPQFLRAAT